MKDLSLDKQILVVINEVVDKRRACAIWFSIISIAIAVIGLNWPKTYESTTTLLRDQAEVVRPLLEGTAFTSSGSQQSEFAKEVIYSNKNLDKVVQLSGLNVDNTGDPLNDRELEILKSILRKKIRIDREGIDILKISYESNIPEEAYIVVSVASRLFIEETTQKKKSGSYEAYSFIENQVNEYKKKLDEINFRINEFKAKNPEVQIESSEGVSNRISVLADQIRRTTLELKEANIRKESLFEQLLIESQKTTAEEVVSAQQQRLAALEGQLNTLRLSYTDTYPDIVQLKEQIRSLKASMADEGESRAQTNIEGLGNRAGLLRSALYDRLKRQIADLETVIKTLEARKLDQERRYNSSIAKSSKVNQLVSKLEELSRDRAVTQQLHDQLLTRRENARVSLSLEMENAGSLFKVQEPPTIPLVPKGLRFLHFVIASIVLGAGIPLGIVTGILIIDSRIRNEESLDLGSDIPVFGSIPILRTLPEATGQKLVTVQVAIIVTLSLTVVAMLAMSRYYEMI